MTVDEIRALYKVNSDAALANILQVTPVAIRHWRTRGVPNLRKQLIEQSKKPETEPTHA